MQCQYLSKMVCHSAEIRVRMMDRSQRDSRGKLLSRWVLEGECFSIYTPRDCVWEPPLHCLHELLRTLVCLASAPRTAQGAMSGPET
jgi:hypothetical protein